MKTTIYILAFLFMGVTFTACTPDTVTEESDRIESTWGEDDNNGEEKEDEEGN
ncbi:hypothetical protein [uncultured Dokdonia sp.]|uniref:hypothetical protein n=1 Tax=Dokdonia sp. Asnod2-E02 TaxID=3160574 RepID=UPI00262443E6|nr:hypothetical protein [uncultured Dokdonia sp.]